LSSFATASILQSQRSINALVGTSYTTQGTDKICFCSRQPHTGLHCRHRYAACALLGVAQFLNYYCTRT